LSTKKQIHGSVGKKIATSFEGWQKRLRSFSSSKTRSQPNSLYLAFLLILCLQQVQWANDPKARDCASGQNWLWKERSTGEPTPDVWVAGTAASGETSRGPVFPDEVWKLRASSVSTRMEARTRTSAR
jgi:hypothetical protein